MVHTIRVDARVRQAAIDANNPIPYAKLQNGDMSPQDPLYHADCLCGLYREAQQTRFGSVVVEKKNDIMALSFQ